MRSDFSLQNLFDKVGRYDRVATFVFEDSSNAFKQYGEMVTGLIRYSKKERDQLEVSLNNGEKTEGNISLKYLGIGKGFDFKQLLRKKGFESNEISEVVYFQSFKNDKFKFKGDRKLSEPIKVEVDLEGIKYENIFLNLVWNRISSNKKLIEEEKYEMLGIYLAQNGKKLPASLIKTIELTEKEVQENSKVWFYYFKQVERERELTGKEKKEYSHFKGRINAERVRIIFDEFKKAGLSKGDSIAPDLIDFLILQLDNFKEERLIQIEHPIYWDFRSFIHVYLRHVKDLQIGNFLAKSSFQYSLTDIKKLIEIVLKELTEDLKNHYQNNSDNKFTRHGSMAVYYEGDHYCLDISSDGRLETIYKQ
ncbi:MAG: hypothetical protein ABJG69_02120 [Balneola sp.]